MNRKDIAVSVRKKLEDRHGYKLRGYCAIGAMALMDAFKKAQYDAVVVWGHTECNSGHCWVESAGYIYDITATQFDVQRRVRVVRDNHPFYRMKELWFEEWDDWFDIWDDYQRPTRNNLRGLTV